MTVFCFLVFGFIFLGSNVINAQLLTTAPTISTLTGTSINTSVITMRPDEDALRQLRDSLPANAQQQIDAIRNNIFLSLGQQNQQIADVVDSLGSYALASYNHIQAALTQRLANITVHLQGLPDGPTKAFIQNREAIFNNTALSMFDFQNRLQGILPTFNALNETNRLEVYNFLQYHVLTGNFTVDEDLMRLPAVVLNDEIRTKLMNLALYDPNSTPMKTFVSLLPAAQQETFNSILTNVNYRKSAIQSKLQALVASWGPAYEMAFNNTIAQQYELLELMLFLEPGLTEPYKTFISQKINLMNNMSITATSESQQFQTLATAFQNALTPMNNFINNYINAR
uniref:WSN domain-containing protein n=1 Tax=Panagrellus redivivus TaxID=6233 RepID=A0A7E4W9N0_PANRE